MPQEPVRDADPAAVASARKAELRRAVLVRRDALSAARRAELSATIFAKVAALEAFREARVVLAYASMGSEPVTDGFVRTVLDAGKTLVLPRLERGVRTLRLHRVGDPTGQLRPGVWGIREPDPAVCPEVSLPEIDFILVPGVAFDVAGGRIGYGGGYYDRLIAACPHHPALIAGAFEVQVVERVPVGPEDRRVDRVITERASYPA